MTRILGPLALALALFASPATSALAAPPEAPTRLLVNDVAGPVGTDASVYFGWLVHDPDPNEIQSAYQILVASSAAKLAADEGDLWDSGQVASRLQNHVPHAGAALHPDRRYHWKIRTWDKTDAPGPWSAPANFTVGPLRNEDWAGASWIRRDSTDKDDYTHYRKTFALPAQPIERATLYVSSVHKYALHLNAHPVGQGPAYQHPQYQYYNAYDVTALLKPGAGNQLAVLNHWFGGGQGRPAGERGFILKLVVHHADGSTTELGTDATWRASRATAWVPGQADRNRGEGVGYVECIDARELRPDWTTLAFDDSAWSPATVIGSHPVAPWTGRLSPDLTRIVETPLAPASITDKGDGKYVIDLGKVYAGLPRIRFSGGASGTTVTMRGGYVLDAAGEIPPGTKAQSTLLEYAAILDGGEFVYSPIEYIGLRYFQIDNAPMPVTAENFSFLVRHTDLDRAASSFSSSLPALDAVWDLMKHSLFTCAHEEFVDTPTREKGGFLGDAVIQSTVGMPVLHERALTQRVLREYLQSMEQHWSAPADRGRINAVYPNNDRGRDIPDFTQAFLPWVWTYYLETGDRAFLATHYAKLKDVADYVHRHTDPANGLVTRLTGGKGPYEFGIIDWPASMRFGYDMSAAARTVINGWAHADYTALAHIAEALGNTADRDTYRAHAAALATAINARLLRPDGLYHDGLLPDGAASPHVSQHANMFPLALGIVRAEHRAAVVAAIKEQRMSVGMVTVSWLVRALARAEEGPHLVELFTNPDWLGWARTLARGGTATWESWHSDTAKDESMSHAWGAAGLETYYRHILGIQPLAPQYEQVLIQPLDFADKLTWAKGHITTDRGPLSVYWIRSTDAYTLRVTLPVNVTAQVALPRGSAPAPVVHLDGVPAPFTIEGKHLVVSGIGSGEHTLVRHDSPPVSARRVSITEAGAVADGDTINTAAIQRAIDDLAASGDGTVVIPPGVFVSGALDLRPGVHLHLERDAVLRASTDMANFPPRRTRIEGHFEERFTPALLNADGCDGLRITGEGILDGDGRKIWDEFWRLRNAAPDKKNFKNLSIPRARLVLIENSRDVMIDGVTFKDSQFWNLHLYRCRDVLVQNTRFVVPDDYKQAPSTDAIDIDSSQDVAIRGCFFSVTDDCIALKGSKGPFANEDSDSPPVERVRVSDCVFKRGHAALNLGSEATIVRDVVLENSRVLGAMTVLNFKLRPDTPQHYEDIHVRGLVLDAAGGAILAVKPWTQYFDLQGQPPPRSTVRNITLTDIRGRFGSFGEIRGNHGQTDIGDIRFENIDLQLGKNALPASRTVRHLKFINVLVNGQPL